MWSWWVVNPYLKNQHSPRVEFKVGGSAWYVDMGFNTNQTSLYITDHSMFKLSKQSISKTIATILAKPLAKQSSSNQQSRPLASGVPHTANVFWVLVWWSNRGAAIWEGIAMSCVMICLLSLLFFKDNWSKYVSVKFQKQRSNHHRARASLSPKWAGGRGDQGNTSRHLLYRPHPLTGLPPAEQQTKSKECATHLNRP